MTAIKYNFIQRWKDQILNVFIQQTSIAPLVILRIAFGAIMFISTLRFISKGWVVEYYVQPIYHFTYYGFEWVRPFDEQTMFLIFYTMVIAAVLVTVGLFYRLSIITFFLLFTYVELIDKTTYLNHYYFVSIVSFLMIWVPANRYFSMDILRKSSLKVTTVPNWCILIFKLQLFLIYFFAGLSKINYDWLIEAMPLRLWLPANSHLPWIGSWLTKEWIAYVFSWGGLLFDLFIGFLLFNKRTVYIAYFFVFVFHAFTALFFQIGMFPYIMMSITLIFFGDRYHQDFINGMRRLAGKKLAGFEQTIPLLITTGYRKFVLILLSVYFLLQVLLPLRYFIYPGHLFWTEEGFRYSWRVMLMEKTGLTFFHVKDPDKGTDLEVNNKIFLTPLQEKMMSTQPDMILQYAHFLGDIYRADGIKDPVVTVESYVTLNGAPSQRFIDKQVNLLKESESFRHKTWILPFVHPKFARCE
ncbi:MAG: deoxyribonuclease HsdR [Chitinophagaceae bacterium]|nr:deoxyribonuclease HsdR [Chitinophagaceae bacterium]